MEPPKSSEIRFTENREPILTTFKSFNFKQRQAVLLDLEKLQQQLQKEEKLAVLRAKPILNLLRLIASISHSIGKLRRQLKGTAMRDYDLDEKWKTGLTVQLITLLKEMAPASRLLELGKFTDFIEQLSEADIPAAVERPEFRNRLVELCLEFRQLERAYIRHIQEWRQKYPRSKAQLRVFESWPDFEESGHCGSWDDLDAVIAYCEKGYNREAYRLMDESCGCENKDENWRLTEKQCRQLGVEYPARLQGLHH